MPVRRRGDGQGQRSGLVNVEYPRNVVRRVAALEATTTLPRGGVRGGGDPNFGYRIEVPLIVDVEPGVTWDGTRFVLSLSIDLSYPTPVPQGFRYIEAEIDGDQGFHTIARLTPYTSPWVLADIGLEPGETYQVRVRAVTSRGASEWGDWFTGVSFGPTFFIPEAPTDFAIDEDFGEDGFEWSGANHARVALTFTPPVNSPQGYYVELHTTGPGPMLLVEATLQSEPDLPFLMGLLQVGKIYAGSITSFIGSFRSEPVALEAFEVPEKPLGPADDFEVTDYVPAEQNVEVVFGWDEPDNMTYISGWQITVEQGDTTMISRWGLVSVASMMILANITGTAWIQAIDEFGALGPATTPIAIDPGQGISESLIRNGSMELITHADPTMARNWNRLSYNPATELTEVDTTEQLDGIRSLRIEALSVGASPAVNSDLFLIPGHVGAKLQFQFSVLTNIEDANITFDLRTYDKNKNPIGPSNILDVFFDNTDGWRKTKTGVPMVEGAKYADVWFRNSSGVVSKIWLDRVIVKETLADDDFDDGVIPQSALDPVVQSILAQVGDELSLLDRARTVGFRNKGTLGGGATFAESSIVYDVAAGLYRVFSTNPVETQNTKLRSASTLEGIAGATLSATLAPLKYPSVVYDPVTATWHMWGTAVSPTRTDHYTSSDPDSGWTLSDTVNVSLFDMGFQKHPTEPYWYGVGFADPPGPSTPLQLIRASDPAGPWTDMGNVFADTGFPPFATDGRPDPNLAFVGGRAYLLFTGRPVTALGVAYYPSIVELDLATGRVKGSPLVLMDEREAWQDPGLSDLHFLRVEGEPDRIIGFNYPLGSLDLPKTNLPDDGRRQDDLVRLDTARGVDVATGIRGAARLGAVWSKRGLAIGTPGGGAHGYPAQAKLTDFTAMCAFEAHSIAPGAVNTMGFVGGADYSGGPFIHIYIDTDGVLKAQIDGDSGAAVTLSSAVTPVLGAIYEVVFRKASTQLAMWVNGTAITPTTHSVDLTGLQIWSIGGQKTLTQAARYPFLGIIHSFVLVGAALSQADVKRHADDANNVYIQGPIINRAGHIQLRPDRTDNVDRRNHALVSDVIAAGDVHLMQSTTNTGDPATRSLISFNKDRLATLYDALLLPEIAAPGTPAAGLAALYVKTDGKVYLKSDVGTEYDLTPSTFVSIAKWSTD